MKTAVIAVGVLFFTLSCQNEIKKEVDYVILSGKLTHYEDDQLTLRGDRYMRYNKAITVNDDGTFSDTLRPPKWNRNYTMYALREEVVMHLRKGGELIVDVDTNRKANPVMYKGKSAIFSHYLTEKATFKSNLFPKGTDMYGFDEEEFRKKQNELKQGWLDILRAQTDLPADFVQQEEKDIYYQYLIHFGRYDFFHGRAIKKDFKSSEGFMDEFLAFNFENEEQFEKSFYYQEMVMTRLRYLRGVERMRLHAENKKYDFNLMWLETIVNNTESEKLREQLLANSTKGYLRSSRMNQEFKIKAYEYYMSQAQDNQQKATVRAALNKAKKIWKGSPSPKFVGYKNYDGSTTSLDDLKGKYVYIDVWATWCTPCLYQIPFLKEVEKKYHNKNIHFVSLSLDKPREEKRWRKMIEDEKLGGIQLLADNEFNSEFIKQYNITGIPRFILIDPEGNIVTPNAPRPSSDKLIKLFNSLNL